MKKLIVFATLVVLASACKKSYTCSCNVESKIDGEVVATSQSTMTITETKKKAREACDGTNGTSNTSMGDMTSSTTYSCKFEE